MSGPLTAALQSAESEAAVLAGLMRENARIDRIADILKPEDFGEDIYGRIYAAILDLASRGKPANALVLRPLFDGDPAFEQAGGSRFLADLSGSSTGLLDPGGMARHVRELAIRRRLYAQMQDTARAVADLTVPIDETVSEHDTLVTASIERTEAEPFRGGLDVIDEVIAGFDRQIIGVTSGGVVDGMDRLVGAIRPSWLGILAGRPGMGKTAAILSYLRGSAARGHNVLFASLEMKWEVLSMRLVADMCHATGAPIAFDAIINGRTTIEQRRTIIRLRDRVAALPFKIIDRRCHTISQLRRAVRRRKRELQSVNQKLDLVIVDYLQLLASDRRGLSEYETVSEVSRELKVMAGDEDVAVIALSQLNRSVDSRADHRPMLTDLRSSGQIEQDADFVVFLLSEEYYLRASEPDPDTPEHATWQADLDRHRDVLEFICAKHRHGRTGTHYGRFFRDYQAVR